MDIEELEVYQLSMDFGERIWKVVMRGTTFQRLLWENS